MKPYLFTLGANLSFALGSMFFTHFSRKFSSIWVNAMKASVASLCFLIAVFVMGGFHEITMINMGVFLFSGFIALGIGDLFLLNAFSILGPGRTMVLFGFQPVIIGGISYFLFNQNIESDKLYGIIFFLLCLFTFSYETFKAKGHWEVKGLLFAFMGMLIDAIGIIITRYAFDMNKNLNAFEGNFYRCIGAIFAYIILSRFIKIDFVRNMKSLTRNSKFYILLGSFLGTFLSLAFYLEAIKTGHLASIAAMAITGVIFASSFECIWEKKMPSKYLIVAFGFFGVGMWFLLFN